MSLFNLLSEAGPGDDYRADPRYGGGVPHLSAPGDRNPNIDYDKLRDWHKEKVTSDREDMKHLLDMLEPSDDVEHIIKVFKLAGKHIHPDTRWFGDGYGSKKWFLQTLKRNYPVKFKRLQDEGLTD
jgi:hypothetical protein